MEPVLSPSPTVARSDPFYGAVADAEAGDVFVVTRDDKPVAVIVGAAHLAALRAELDVDA